MTQLFEIENRRSNRHAQTFMTVHVHIKRLGLRPPNCQPAAGPGPSIGRPPRCSQKKCNNYVHYVQIMRKLCKNYANIMRVMHIMLDLNSYANYAKIMQKLCENYATIMRTCCSRRLCENYAKLCENYANYANVKKLCGLCRSHFADDVI